MQNLNTVVSLKYSLNVSRETFIYITKNSKLNLFFLQFPFSVKLPNKFINVYIKFYVSRETLGRYTL